MVVFSADQKSKEATLVRQMSGKLRDDIIAFEKYRHQHTQRTFYQFCSIRNKHNEIQGLIFTIQDRMPMVQDLLPENMANWVMRAKLMALTIFAEISREFVSNPPLTLTGSLTARDVLSLEQANFAEAQKFFNSVLMEQALDDKTAGELDHTLELIEETIGMIQALLSKSKNYLQDF
ncbi:conserved hypothetical protein [uncultured Gammaproteobacteria bacterium]